MTNKTGVATAVFDNRTYQGTPSKYPSYKIMMGDEEFVCYTGNNIEVKQGDSISIEYDISKKTGKKFILSNSAKMPMIQVIPQDGTAPVEEIPVYDDDLSNMQPDHFASNGVEDKSDFNYGANKQPTTQFVDNKSMQIFCSAMTKSALESSALKADKVSIQSFIKDMKEIFKSEF